MRKGLYRNMTTEELLALCDSAGATELELELAARLAKVMDIVSRWAESVPHATQENIRGPNT